MCKIKLTRLPWKPESVKADSAGNSSQFDISRLLKRTKVLVRRVPAGYSEIQDSIQKTACIYRILLFEWQVPCFEIPWRPHLSRFWRLGWTAAATSCWRRRICGLSFCVYWDWFPRTAGRGVFCCWRNGSLETAEKGDGAWRVCRSSWRDWTRFRCRWYLPGNCRNSHRTFQRSCWPQFRCSSFFQEYYS